MSDHEQWDIVSGVGVTALAVALARAMETRRTDGLVDDPYAEAFLAASHLPERYRRWPALDSFGTAALDPFWDSMPTYMGVRTRFFDDFFAAAGEAGVRQVVLVAAGLDTRAFRLDWSDGTEVFEVDQPLVLSFKEEVLGQQNAAARCVRHPVPADLRDDWADALRAAGFDTSRPTAWLAEGLLSFLPADAERNLFATITDLSAPGSRLAVEAVAGNARDKALYSPVASAWETYVGVDVRALWNTELRPEPVDVVRSSGWKITIERVAEAARRYQRPVRGVMMVPAEHSMLLTATR
jgi:methyltransferase (TIGR00027 family)